MAKRTRNFYYSDELRKKAKRANQRMREFEKRDIKSPAYKRVQAALEMLGVQKKSTKGRRFSETGYVTNKNVEKRVLSIVDKFLNAKTSTIKGFKEYKQNIYDSANEKYHLADSSISVDDYFELWESLPDREKDRVFYAAFYIEVMQTYEMKKKSGQIINENAYTVSELVDIMQSSKSYNEALKRIGLTSKDINETRKRFYSEDE